IFNLLAVMLFIGLVSISCQEEVPQPTIENTSVNEDVNGIGWTCQPTTPTIAVEASSAYEVCPGEIFEAYVTNFPGGGFKGYEWLFHSPTIQLLPGYTKASARVKFRVVGSAYSGSFLKVKAKYCNNNSLARTSTSWNFGIQNCSGGPHI
ncbi:MAG: hypothetical protein AAFO69_08100, partial [Bacteroidota bacterium]